MESVRIEGLRELNRALQELDNRTSRRVLNRSVNAGAKLIRDEARNRAPIDEGRLRRNIITKKGRAPRGAANYFVLVRGINPRTGNSDDSMKTHDPKNAYYGRFVEMGTSKMSPRPFMAPSFETKKGMAVEAIKKTLGEGIEQEARRVRRN